ncbi:hypothetical protein CAP48_10175 [Advenella sp. S44]|uniref:hypothetical protein n=1 Tax=Advenella sp. S44 TaxID=1982755 RepID=UPI000C2AB0FD|nr:hypothetical protein [Advenella sp. S44]PJX26348.1 hypothetical protein CAP48_10175 [Advenella sp. S44]
MTDTSTNALFIITSATNAPYTEISGRDTANNDNKAACNGASASSNTSDGSGQSVPSYDNLMATIYSINTHAPGSRIALVEYSAYPLSQPQHNALIEHVDYLMSYSGNEQIQRLDRQLRSSQAIASFSELTCLMWFLQVGQHHDLYKSFNRVFKISPGVQLLAPPADTVHFSDNAKGRYVFPNATLAANATGALALQFSNKYWSMDAELVPSFIALLQQMLQAMHELNEQGQAVSVPSMLYKFIDAGKIFYDLKPNVTGQ